VRHYHHCPYCYESFACELICTIEPDLEQNGRDFGSHVICHDVICHIDRAIKKCNEGYERRQREALRRLCPAWFCMACLQPTNVCVCRVSKVVDDLSDKP
jgi:hypothetical protein